MFKSSFCFFFDYNVVRVHCVVYSLVFLVYWLSTTTSINYIKKGVEDLISNLVILTTIKALTCDPLCAVWEIAQDDQLVVGGEIDELIVG